MKLKNIIKYLSIIAILSIFFLFFQNKANETYNPRQNSDNITYNDTDNTPLLSEYEIIGYKVLIKKIYNPDANIIPNFEDTKTSEEIFESFDCSTIINGGLYTKYRTPLGLYSLEGKQYAKINNNSDNSGILIFDKNNNWSIINSDDFDPNEYHYFIMQSGPLFVNESKFSDILIKNEIKGRRIVFALDDIDQIFLIIVFDNNNLNSGPNISELKQILEYISKNNLIKLNTALNLDGGDSSIFIDKNYSLRESSFPGTFICFK